MINEYTAVIKKKSKWWIDWMEEVPGVREGLWTSYQFMTFFEN